MGNKSSKKTEAATTAVAKHQFSTSTKYRAPAAPTAQNHNNGQDWVMVLNATAYIHCGSLSNAGAVANMAATNGAALLSEQTYSMNKQAVVVSRNNTLTQHHSNASNADYLALPRQNVPFGMEAINMEKNNKPYQFKDDWFGIERVAAKPSGTTSTEIKPLTFHEMKEAKPGKPPSKVRTLKEEPVLPASTYNGSKFVPSTKQNIGTKYQTAVVTTSQNTNMTKTPAATTCNAMTVYNSAVSKKNVEARFASDGYDWFNTLTLRSNEVKQQAVDNVRKGTPRLQLQAKPQLAKQHNTQSQNERGGRAQDGFTWREVNRAEGGCWNHFRKTSGGWYKCTLCNVSLSGTQSIIEHAWGKFHQARLEKKRASETEEDLMWRKVPKPEKFHRNYIYYEIDDDDKPLFYCSICDVDVPFAYQNLLTHIRGRNHSDEVESRDSDY